MSHEHTLPSFLRAVGDVFDVGEDFEVVADLHGGVNRVLRIRSCRGDLAVHHLVELTDDEVHVSRCGWVASLELAALDAGVRVPRPVLAPITNAAAVAVPGTNGLFTVHEWCEGTPIGPDQISPTFAASLGEALGRIHRLEHTDPTGPDLLDRRPAAADWVAVASEARAAGFGWASAIEDAAERLESAIRTLDQWDAQSDAPVVASHRDLTSANLLNDHEHAVLIDWESSGRIATSAELGRTALDNFLDDDVLDDRLLVPYLTSYGEHAPLPAIALDWCSLWIRGLIVFADQCARSLLIGNKPPSLLEFQRAVVAATPNELERRLRLTPSLLDQFNQAARG